MPDRSYRGVIPYLRHIVGREEAIPVSDGQLLGRFVTQHDEAAFELLVRRHGKMVLDLCRRLLHDEQTAEDAFQAAFLVLARRAASIDKRSSLGGWLYKVAYRVALEARTRTGRQALRERPLRDEYLAAAVPDPRVDAEQRELRFVIDEEVNRLPAKYRQPFVLCYFEGKSNGEAARELGCPLGTVESRLTRARQRLRGRLTGRGFAPSIGLVAVGSTEGMASAEVPTSLVASTVNVAARGATGLAAAAISANVAALTEAGMKSMSMTKRTVVAVVLTVSLVGTGAGLFAHRTWEDKPGERAPDHPQAVENRSKEAKALALPKAEPKFATAPGYAWAIQPQDGRGISWAIGWRPPPQPGLPANAGICAIEDTTKGGGLQITLAHPPSKNNALPDYRPVAFDAQHKRYLLKSDAGVGTATATLARYSLDPKVLPADKVKYLGVEVLTPEGPKAIARRAAEQAKKTGIEVLPFPRIGESYDFTLTTMDGRKIHARDLRGKVVLVDCWATWCSPCMSLLPEIKKLYEKWHADGLEVIGINFDHNAAKARKTCKRLGLAWPQVLVPNDETIRQLWQEASDIGCLPRVLLIDRDGILRADGASQLDEAIAKLLKHRDRPAELSSRRIVYRETSQRSVADVHFLPIDPYREPQRGISFPREDGNEMRTYARTAYANKKVISIPNNSTFTSAPEELKVDTSNGMPNTLSVIVSVPLAFTVKVPSNNRSRLASKGGTIGIAGGEGWGVGGGDGGGDGGDGGGSTLTVSVAALVVTLPALLVNTASYSFPLVGAATLLIVNVALIAPLMLVKVFPPSLLTCHCTLGCGSPLAAAINVAVWPSVTVWSLGLVVTVGAAVLCEVQPSARCGRR